ncbi:MAG: 4-hydroxy-3-methylbut-2-enyl diphosphate reductase [Bacteroidota bacterium]
MKQFDIPTFYRSPIISEVKKVRKTLDPRKKDFTPTVLDFGPVEIYIARHFGFCYGVENAIEISYRALEENRGKNIFLLSQMIHNPAVNEDLESHGIRFLQDTEGNELISFDELSRDDVVIVPAFGTTLEIEQLLDEKGVDIQAYNTTCPFVEKVWNRSKKLGKDDHTIIIHGKHNHEETRATFSHSAANAPSVVVKNLEETKLLARYILKELPAGDFFKDFEGRYTAGFSPERDLKKVGVVNQTTMLASETQEIADFVKQVMIEKYGTDELKEHFADTRDTLCYATNDNQNATYGLMAAEADLALVVGGYNSSNTTHLVELLEEKFTTYFIEGVHKIEEGEKITAFDIHKKREFTKDAFLPHKAKDKVIITSGASCPDASVDQVLHQLLSFYSNTHSVSDVLKNFAQKNAK